MSKSTDNQSESLEMKPQSVGEELYLVHLKRHAREEPDEFLDEILSSFMSDPVILPSGHYVDRSTITQHLLNDPIDPFNREAMTIDDVKPATELKEKMNLWLAEKRAERVIF